MDKENDEDDHGVERREEEGVEGRGKKEEYGRVTKFTKYSFVISLRIDTNGLSDALMTHWTLWLTSVK